MTTPSAAAGRTRDHRSGDGTYPVDFCHLDGAANKGTWCPWPLPSVMKVLQMAALLMFVQVYRAFSPGVIWWKLF
jgi:hypothetical protein